MPRVSVIIPCHNYAQFLPDAVGSVLHQTYRDFEIVVVNDGSTDDTQQVAGRLAVESGSVRFRILRQENQGLPTARNNGIKAAAGEYILPLDADDMIEPEFLQETVRILDADSTVSIAYPLSRPFGDVTEEEAESTFVQEYDFNLLLERNILPVCSLFRRSAWEQVRGYKPLRGYADWEFWIALGEAGHRGRLVRKPLWLYRKHGASMIDQSLEIHDELSSEIRRLHPGVYTPDVLNRIIFHQGASISALRAGNRRLQAELAQLRTGRGSLRNAWARMVRRLVLPRR